ncbi:MAG: hypothetical protein BGO98_25960 [Myxococcales bacterium 68-20]|nr:MAG: hypothetical protein BGO98_25960 [Myxococcales bacterium 68-20]
MAMTRVDADAPPGDGARTFAVYVIAPEAALARLEAGTSSMAGSRSDAVFVRKTRASCNRTM